MDQIALNNINTLLNIDEKSTFIFQNKQILINNDNSTEHVNENNINTEYILYFTFNQLFNAIRHENINRNKLINELEQSLNNLYENESFLKLIDNDKQIDEIMNDISLKLDIIAQKYYNHYECKNCYNKLNNFYNYLIEDFINKIPLHIYTNMDDIDDESLIDIDSINKVD